MRPLILAALILAGCGDDPAGPEWPDVAGQYEGTFVVSTPETEGVGLSFPISFSVRQNGPEVTVTNIEILDGDVVVPAFTGTINAAGFFTLSEGAGLGTYSGPEDADCGTVTAFSGSLTFSDHGAEWLETVTTELCGILQVRITVTRKS